MTFRMLNQTYREKEQIFTIKHQGNKKYSDYEARDLETLLIALTNNLRKKQENNLVESFELVIKNNFSQNGVKVSVNHLNDVKTLNNLEKIVLSSTKEDKIEKEIKVERDFKKAFVNEVISFLENDKKDKYKLKSKRLRREAV